MLLDLTFNLAIVTLTISQLAGWNLHSFVLSWTRGLQFLHSVVFLNAVAFLTYAHNGDKLIWITMLNL